MKSEHSEKYTLQQTSKSQHTGDAGRMFLKCSHTENLMGVGWGGDRKGREEELGYVKWKQNK